MKRYVSPIFAIISITLGCSQQNSGHIRATVISAKSTQTLINVQNDRGNSFMDDVKSELSTSKEVNQGVKRSRLTYVLDKMLAIDSATIEIISLLESVKMRLLQRSNQSFTPENGIIRYHEENYKKSMIPFSIQFERLKTPENTTILQEICTGSPKLLDSIWKGLNKFRYKLVYQTGTYNLFSENSFSVPYYKNNQFKNKKQLKELVRKKFEPHVNVKEDMQVLIDLYALTSYNKTMRMLNGEKMSWTNYYFQDCNLIEAINTISSLEATIYSARALALEHWKCKFVQCGYAFDKILTVLDGPSAGKVGDTLYFKAFFGAVDSYNPPTLTVNGLPAIIHYSEGSAYFQIVLPESIESIKLSGTLSIKNKSGIRKVETWEREVHVL